MQNFEQTIISQYGTSPILLQLIHNMDEYIDPSADIDTFLSFILDVDTAQFWGLDILGKIVGVDRYLKIPPEIAEPYFGFKATENQPFGQAPFFHITAATDTYALSDTAFRTLIKLKALANISATNIPSLNQMLNNLFPGRGRCFVADQGNMQMLFIFEFYLQPFEVAILTQSGVLSRPVGVLCAMLRTDADTWGFKQASANTFNNGTFFLRSTGILPIS